MIKIIPIITLDKCRYIKIESDWYIETSHSYCIIGNPGTVALLEIKANITLSDKLKELKNSGN